MAQPSRWHLFGFSLQSFSIILDSQDDHAPQPYQRFNITYPSRLQSLSQTCPRKFTAITALVTSARAVDTSVLRIYGRTCSFTSVPAGTSDKAALECAQKRWTPAEDATLLRLVEEKASWEERCRQLPG